VSMSTHLCELLASAEKQGDTTMHSIIWTSYTWKSYPSRAFGPYVQQQSDYSYHETSILFISNGEVCQ
jgi:hypothetical protein